MESDRYFFDKVKEYCKIINTDFNEDWILAQQIHRYEYAQPVCTPGFLGRLPPIKTEIEGLFIMDTSYHYPEDRSMSESIKLAKDVAEIITLQEEYL